MLSVGRNFPVAISTLRDEVLAETIANLKPKGLSIVGKTHTENIGIDKVIKTVLAASSIKYLILCGKESGHYSGDTLVSLAQKGVDNNMRVIGSKAKKPILANTTSGEVDLFRKKIKIINMIDCDDLDIILKKLDEVFQKAISERVCNKPCSIENNKIVTSTPQVITAKEKDPKMVKLDRAGYFVIVPKINTVWVEHYNNANQLLRIIKGDNARDIYWTIIENGWITEFSHAAYLGKELARAELSLKLGFKYVQDMA